ncbi:MAG: PEP-CTERM sorting domain-containing protein [Verrucomicrobiaceae bacterium]|nr:MAG: PEP-CTERM sorting domain-containing protein [Verrucomicrobiaceae bacterium]
MLGTTHILLFVILHPRHMKRSIISFVLATLFGSLSGHAATTFQSDLTSKIHYGGIMILDPVFPHESRSPWAPILNVNSSTSLTIDPDAGTARFVAQIAPTSLTTTFTTPVYTQQVGSLPPVFPNPPQPIFASGTATISVTFNVAATTIDTGVRAFGWNGTAYSMGPYVQDIEASLGIVCSVTSGGETTTLTQTFDLGLTFNTSGIMDVGNYPNSAAMGFNFLLPNGNQFHFNVPPVTAPNGFQSELVIVPEPSSSLLLGAGAIGLLIRRKRSSA